MSALKSQQLQQPAGGVRWSKYSAAYQKRLVEGGKELNAFLLKNGISWNFLSQGKSRTADEILESFVSEKMLENCKSSLRVAKHAVLLLQVMRPRLRKKLQNTWTALRSWEEQLPSGYRPPLPPALLAALVCQSCVRAQQADNSKERHLWFALTTLTLAGFFGLLRPGEMFQLTAGDVVPANSLALASSFAVIRINRPKNARQMGAQQYVEVRHPDAINWLSWLKTQRGKDEQALWPSTAHTFRKMFKKLCHSLRLERLRFSPASLRAGGATWMVDSGFEINRIRFWGRWANLRSLEHYIQVARAQQISLDLPPATVQCLKRLLMKYGFMLSLPEFFAAQVASEHLVASIVFTPKNSEDVVSAIRRWGELAKTV